MLKPMLFNTEMVRAILDGRKTVTRRIIKPQPKSQVVFHLGNWQETEMCANGLRILIPPCRPGDVFYVRETWGHTDDLPGISEEDTVYAADFSDKELAHLKDKHFRWRPSIHMPKELARLFLKVKSVRAERLQIMEIADFAKEGVQPRALKAHGCECVWKQDGCRDKPCTNRDAYELLTYAHPFSELWDSTIPKADLDTYGWKANPWVWVIQFEVCEKNGGS